jgi:hypothetical protein
LSTKTLSVESQTDISNEPTKKEHKHKPRAARRASRSKKAKKAEAYLSDIKRFKKAYRHKNNKYHSYAVKRFDEMVKHYFREHSAKSDTTLSGSATSTHAAP